MYTFILILTVNISQCSQHYRQHTGRDSMLRALANILSAGDVQSSTEEEGIVGSLNTVFLCGCSPKCFSVCAWVMHQSKLQQTTHTRGSTLDFVSILAPKQTWRKVEFKNTVSKRWRYKMMAFNFSAIYSALIVFGSIVYMQVDIGCNCTTLQCLMLIKSNVN